MKTRTIIVDEKDMVIGYKYWEDVDFSKDFIRASSLWLEDSLGNVLLQKRSYSMEFNPGRYTFAVGGINDEGDSYTSAIIRETKEEIGLHIENPKYIGTVKLKEKIRKGFVAYFKIVIPGNKPEINFDNEELLGVRWISKEGLKKEMVKKPEIFVQSILEIPEKFGLL